MRKTLLVMSAVLALGISPRAFAHWDDDDGYSEENTEDIKHEQERVREEHQRERAEDEECRAQEKREREDQEREERSRDDR